MRMYMLHIPYGVVVVIQLNHNIDAIKKKGVKKKIK